MPDHYRILGLAANATPDEIKRAYRKRSSEAHPDRKGGSHEEQQAVNAAYAVLSDPERRRRYDAGEADKPAANHQPEYALVIQLFGSALEANPSTGAALAAVKSELKRRRGAQQTGSAQAKQLLRSLERGEKTLKFKGEGDSLLHEVLAHKKAQLLATIDSATVKVVEFTAALKLLDEYEAEGEVTAPDSDDFPTMTFQFNPSFDGDWGNRSDWK